MKISACLITLNEEQDLPRCLRSIAGLADEIVVIDSGSTDGTQAVAESFGARVVHQDWLGYVGQKNFALSAATHPWVLSIDADEELSPELSEAIRRLREQRSDTGASTDSGDAAPAGYIFRRMVQYRGRWIRHGDWYPDPLVRLFLRDKAHFAGGRVHERMELQGATTLLPGHLHHFTYKDADDRNKRIERYATLWAETAYEKGKKVGPLAPFMHSTVRLLRGFLLKRGFLDGAIGWDIASGNAREVWMKYQLLRDMEQKRKSVSQ
jgi:glycosyltransferase involved in cell wall biosynthesis